MITRTNVYGRAAVKKSEREIKCTVRIEIRTRRILKPAERCARVSMKEQRNAHRQDETQLKFQRRVK